MNNTTRLQLIEGPQKGFLEIKEGVKVPLNFSISDIRDISSRSGMFSKTIALAGTKNNNNLLNNYFDVNIVAGTFDVNKRQKVAIVQNGIILRDNCYMRLLKVKKKQSVDTNIDEWVEYEVQVIDELGDFFKEVGNKEVKELDGWEEYKHIYGVDAVVDSFDHTVDDGYKYTLPWISNNQFEMNDLMPGIYAKQIFDRIHSMNGFSYDWATMTDDDTQFDKSILPYAGDKKKLTEEYIEKNKVIADNKNTQTNKITLGSYGPPGTGSPGTDTRKTEKTIINNETRDNNNQYDDTLSEFTNPYTLLAPSSINYTFKIEWEVEVKNTSPVKLTVGGYDNSALPNGTTANSKTGVIPIVGVRKVGGIIQGMDNLVDDITFSKFNFPIGHPDVGLNGTDIGAIETIDGNKTIVHKRKFELEPNETVLFCSASNEVTIPITTINDGDVLESVNQLDVIMRSSFLSWYSTSNNYFGQVEYNYIIKNIEVEISISPDSALLPGSTIDIRNFLPNKMKQSEFLKTIYQKYNLYVEIDPDNPSKLIYTSRDEFYDVGTVKDWTEKLDKKRVQELYFIPDITTKRMILSYKDDDKDPLLDAYRGETSKTFGQVDAIFDNENIKGEERKEEVFSPTINMETEFGAILPVLNADFKMNPRILQDGGKLQCQQYSLKESDSKTVTTSFYPHLSMFDKPYNPTFSTEYAQSSYYAYKPGLFTQNTLYNLHWRRTLAQINSGKMLKAYFWLTEEDIQGLRMNDKIKVNNALYYINAIIDYDANSNSVTKVELLTVEDDLKLPRVGGGIKNVEAIEGIVSGTLRPKVPSVPGGFFTGAISEVIKKRYDATVIVSSPTSLTGNLGIGNTIPSGFRGVIVGDNLRPTEDGVYIDDISITNSGIFKEDSNGDKVGISLDDDGNIEFTGTVDFSNAIVPELDDKVESVTGTGVDNTDPINPVISIDKHTIGLGNVDNIQQIPLADKGANNGVAELDSSGKIPISQLPSYVSDVETYPTLSSFPTTGDDGVIYIAEDTNLTYRWTGSTYVEISPSIALGETSSTAYRGDRGKIAYDHSLLTSGNPHNVSKSDVGLGNVDNTSDADKPISTTTQSALNNKQDTLVSGVNIKTIDGQSLLGAGDIPIPPGQILSSGNAINIDGSNNINVLYDNSTIKLNGSGQLYVDGFLTDTTYTAGTNISISGSNVISATNTTYSVGTLAQLNTGTNTTNRVWSAKILSDWINGKGYVTSDTTYSAGNGLTLTGTTFSLPITYSGSGNNITNIVQNSNGITVTRANLPNHIQNLQQVLNQGSNADISTAVLITNNLANQWGGHHHTIGSYNMDGASLLGGVANSIGNNATSNYSAIVSGNFNVVEAERSVVVGGSRNKITHNNSVILGGGLLISKEADTTHTQKLNIDEVKNTPSVKTLGIDANGFVTEADLTGGVINRSYSQLIALKNSNSLEEGSLYFITDRDIWLRAISSNELSISGKRRFMIVKDDHYTPHTTSGAYRSMGIYGQFYAEGSHPNSTTTINRFVIWGGRVWRRNNTGGDGGILMVGSQLSNDTLGSGWTKVTAFNSNYYENKIFDIKYNFDDDIIWEQSDDRGNVIKILSTSNNTIDITDWGNVRISNNECYGIYNNYWNSAIKANIARNSNNGGIYRNSNNGGIYRNSNSGAIFDNSNSGSIYINSNNGDIFDNSNGGIIYRNSNIGDISDNSNSGIIYINSNGGVISDNSNNGVISDNSNSDDINNNTNRGDIRFNKNNGKIEYNDSNHLTTMTIRNNWNNGDIRYNRGTANIEIRDNMNNGPVGPFGTSYTNRSSDVADTWVQK